MATKIYVKECGKEYEVTGKPTNFCSFIDGKGVKGYLVYTGEKMKAVAFEEGSSSPNRAYGSTGINEYSSIDEFLREGIKGCYTEVGAIFFHGSLEEMHRWLLGDI
jgi:hypothetical protein